MGARWHRPRRQEQGPRQEHGRRHGRWGRWATLLGAVATILALMAAAQRWSPALPGAAGDLYRNNTAREYTPAAYFYTEVTDVAEFVGEDGRYGGTAR